MANKHESESGAAVACSALLATFGTEYPIMADLKDGWYLVAHPNGPAIAHAKFDLLASLAHQHEDLPEEVRREAVWQLMRWAANQPTWPKVANSKVSDGGPLTHESPAAQSRRSLH